MTGLSVQVALVSPWRSAQRRVECYLAIPLLLLGSFAAIAESADGTPPAGTTRKSEIAPKEQVNSARSRESAKRECRTLLITVEMFLDEGNIEEAVEAQRKLVSLWETVAGKAYWQTRTEQALLAELEQVSKLTQQQRKTYLVASRTATDAARQAAIGDHDGAEKLLDNALRSYTTVLGEDSVSVGGALKGLGISALANGDLPKARECALRSAAIWKTAVGEDHPYYLRALRLVGSACREANDFDQAEAMFREVSKQYRRLLGVRSLDYADLLAELAHVMIEKEKFIEAEALCLQAISVMKDAPRQPTPIMAACLFSLAEINIAREEYREAEANLQRCLELYEKGLPPWSLVVPRLHDRYIWLLRKTERPDEAKAMEARAEAVHILRR